MTVNDQVVSAIGKGILVLAAIGPNDTKKDAESMASKVMKMKLWPDENDSNWKKSVQDIGGEVLCVSQFTLLASTKKGSKPDFHGAASSAMAKELYDYFLAQVREKYHADKVKDGVFQAMMQVSLVNDGPVCGHGPTISSGMPRRCGDGADIQRTAGYTRNRHQSCEESIHHEQRDHAYLDSSFRTCQ